MTNRTLARRLEDLEDQFRPIVGEAKTFIIEFVDSGRKVVRSMEVKLPARPSIPRGRRWRR